MDLLAGADGLVTEAAALSLRNISRRFGSVAALSDVTVSFRAGRVHALLGQNGAGKTTLMRVAYGMVRPDSGTIERLGRQLTVRSPRDALSAGIGMVHQHFSLVPAMTVAENVALGRSGRLDLSDVAERVRAVGTSTGFALDPHARVSELSIAAQQQTEIIKALARDVRVLILDEPTAVLAPAERDELMRRLRSLADSGCAVVLITHKLREALAIADDVTVLRGGRVVHESAGAVSESVLVDAMIGTAAPQRASDSSVAGPRTGDIVVSIAGVHASDEAGVERLRDATLQVRGGEIVGVAGVERSGHRELLRVCAGRLGATAGTVVTDQRAGFVPEDRHRDAAVPEFSLVENVALNGAGKRRGRMPWDALRVATQKLIDDFSIAASSPSQSLRTLSGGNQQRLVLARELENATALIVLENPTRGLDVGATAAIHDALRRARAAGRAVLLYSADLDELLALADRIVVCHGGRVVETARNLTAIGQALVGSALNTH